MKPKIIATSIAIVATLFVWPAQAQIYDSNNDTVSTFAGYGIPGYVDGQGVLTAFNNPTLIVADTASNLYVWDSCNQRIRKITPDRTVSTFVGGGSFLEGYGTNVSLAWGQVATMAMDNANQLWIVMANGSYYNSNPNFLITIGTNGCVSIANGGLTDFSSSSGICFDSANNFYYSGGNRIYRYNPVSGVDQPFAGSGISGYFDGPGILFSAFSSPTALACDQADNIYVWDSGNGRIRRIDQMQHVTTIAGGGNNYSSADGDGTNAGFSGINSMFFDHAGNLYLVCGSCVRKMDAQANVDTLAGTFYSYFSPSYADGPGDIARFSSAYGGCFSQGMVFVADGGNNRIRNITFNTQAQPVVPANLQLNTYPGLQITGAVGRTYQIQSSSDMASWIAVATVLLTSSPYLWIDRNPISGKKFYRAVIVP